MSQEDFITALQSKGVAITRAAVSRWENDRAVPQAFPLKKMAEMFKVSMEYLLDGTNFPVTTIDDEICEVVATLTDDRKEQLLHIAAAFAAADASKKGPRAIG